MCSHKNIKCKIISPCCGKAFSCNRCHDEYYDNKKNTHNIERTKIYRIMCVKCNEYQDISNRCTKCNICFAEYYCGICKVFDNSIDNYHCEKCGMCIVGNKNKYLHCDKCKCCIEKTKYNSHKCFSDVLEGTCTICMDLLKNGEKVLLMSCGHALHNDCFVDLIDTSYKCPQCSKTIKDMTYEFALLDRDIKNQPMPENKLINIKCNDCDKTSTTNYHYLGAKCTYCFSYNTSNISE